MPSISTPATVAEPAVRNRHAKRKVGYQQRLDDQIAQFRAFLDDHTKDGSPLPGWHGKVVVSTLLVAANLSNQLDGRSPVFREIAQEYAQKVGLTTSASFRTELLAAVPAELSPVSGLSYQQLFDLDADALQLKNPKSLAAYHSALDRFMLFSGKTRVDQIGPELVGQYEQALQQFIQKHYRPDQNFRSAKSYLNKYWQIITKRQRTDGLPAALDAALTQLVKQDGRSPGDLAEAIGQRRDYVHTLTSGFRKSASSEVLARLEEELNVEPGTLTRRVVLLNPRRHKHFCPLFLLPEELQGPETHVMRRRMQLRKLLPDHFPSLSTAEQRQLISDTLEDIANKRHLSAYGITLSKIQESPYLLKPDQMSPQLKQEFDALCEMKRTRGSMGKKSKNKLWNAASENRWKSVMSSFLGWCLLPTNALNPIAKGAGLSPNDLTLGLILLPELIEGYMTFRSARAGDKDTKTSAMFLTECLSMLRQGHGWVEGHPELLQRMPTVFQQSSDTWQAKCAAQLSFITDVGDELDIVIGRESFEPIQPLINSGRPMDVVQQALANNWDELQTKLRSNLTDRQKARLYGEHVLISMLAALPLRSSHWCNMTHRTTARNLTSKDDGQLRHVDGQHWGLYLRAKDFKNSRNQTIFGPNADRDLALLFCETENAFKDLEPLIDEYMRVHRPLLCAGNGPVFPDEHGLALTGHGLYTLVRKWTKRYLSERGDPRYGLCLPGVKPFGPHAFRHLMASHILKTTGKYEDAANMLLDSVAMVMKHYAQFMPEDRLQLTFARLNISRATRTFL